MMNSSDQYATKTLPTDYESLIARFPPRVIRSRSSPEETLQVVKEFVHPDNLSIALPNPDLEAEDSHSFELGFRHDSGSWTTTSSWILPDITESRITWSFEEVSKIFSTRNTFFGRARIAEPAMVGEFPTAVIPSRGSMPLSRSNSSSKARKATLENRNPTAANFRWK